jgi:hypothetical protein
MGKGTPLRPWQSLEITTRCKCQGKTLQICDKHTILFNSFSVV